MTSPALRTGDLFVIVLVPLLFATNVIIGRAVVPQVGPWTLAFLRWSFAFLIVLPFAAGGIVAAWDSLRRQAGTIAILAFLGMWVCGGAFYMALQHTTATNATLIYASANVMILLLEWAFRGRRVGLRESAGAGLAFAGVAVIALGSGSAAEIELNPGDAIVFLAAFSWAIYSVALKRPELTALPGLPLFAAVMLAGIALLCPMMVWEATGAKDVFPATASAWAATAGLALMPSVGAFFGYQYGIRRFGPAKMAMSSYLWTPYGILLAVTFLGEALRLQHVFGFVLILPGVVLATFRDAPRSDVREDERSLEVDQLPDTEGDKP